ncbi:MAG TPA: 50S ribosomal protein L15 [Candidatus Krumholzibacteria bacterium]|nr:50S ribosomal protein L15 [Candidatus Krumholzibacteria bacterium]
MKLNEIRRPAGNKKPKPRKGRGPGSGLGKTAGRGHKGQKARSGAKFRAWFEGGQMPVNRRLPKRGFYNRFSVRYQLVNLRDLERLGDVTEADAAVLAAHGLVKDPRGRVKLLGDGEVNKALTLVVDKASRSAVAAIEAAGGKVEIRAGEPESTNQG